MKILLKDKNAVIYGAGALIGGAGEGATVSLAGRTPKRLEEVAAQIRTAGGVAERSRVDALDDLYASIGGYPMSHTSYLAKEVLEDLITTERTLWENDAETYHDGYSPEALLIFPGVGRIDRDTAVAAIRQENAEGRAWAEVRFGDVDGRWIESDAAALITYTATARWNYESSASETLCASVYVRVGGSWRVAFHQQTPT